MEHAQHHRLIRPTHTCFDDALDFVSWVNQTAPHTLVEYNIVHALCQVGTGPLFAHAWVEHLPTAMVFVAGLLVDQRVIVTHDREEYRAFFVVKDETQYTVREALSENSRTGHYGPWCEKYRALCHPIG